MQDVAVLATMERKVQPFLDPQTSTNERFPTSGASLPAPCNKSLWTTNGPPNMGFSCTPPAHGFWALQCKSLLCGQAVGGLSRDRVEQRHVFSPLDGQLVAGIVVDDFWDVVEGRAVLAQDKLVVFCLQEFHVKEPLAAPRERERRGTQHICAIRVPAIPFNDCDTPSYQEEEAFV